MQKVILIEGMHCPHCSGAVTKALTKLAGVTSVDVSLEKKCAVIECEETVTDDVLKATITDLDFEVKRHRNENNGVLISVAVTRTDDSSSNGCRPFLQPIYLRRTKENAPNRIAI